MAREILSVFSKHEPCVICEGDKRYASRILGIPTLTRLTVIGIDGKPVTFSKRNNGEYCQMGMPKGFNSLKFGSQI